MTDDWHNFLCDSCHEFAPHAHRTPHSNRLCDACYARYKADTITNKKGDR